MKRELQISANIWWSISVERELLSISACGGEQYEFVARSDDTDAEGRGVTERDALDNFVDNAFPSAPLPHCAHVDEWRMKEPFQRFMQLVWSN